MQSEDDDDLSLSQILYALILALTPFVEGLIADAAREGRTTNPGLRALARTLAAMRFFATLFVKPGQTHAQTRPQTPRSARPHARRTPARRQPQSARPASSLQFRRQGVTPPPVRTLEL